MTWKNKRLLGLHHLTWTMCHLTPAINYISGHTKLLEEKNDKPKNTQNTIFNMCISPPWGLQSCVFCFFFVSWFFGVGGVGWSLREETLQRWRGIARYQLSRHTKPKQKTHCLRRKCCNLRTPTVACSDIKPVDYDYMTGWPQNSPKWNVWQFWDSEIYSSFISQINSHHSSDAETWGPKLIPPDSCRLYGWHRHPISGCRSPTSSEVLRSKQDIDRWDFLERQQQYTIWVNLW